MKFLRTFVLLAAALLSVPASALSITTECGIPCHQSQMGLVFAQQIPPGTSTTPVQLPPATQNTITTTGPVASETTISVGTLAGQVLNWIAVAFAGPIGAMVVWVLVRVLKKLGIDATDALRARLQDLIVNGLNAGAKVAQERLAGQGKVEIKNAATEYAVAYVQAHGEETMKALGLDPKSGAAVEAIKARIETAIADPATPTAPVLDPSAKV